MKVINFFGGPGAGKSTAAAGLFYLLKKKKYNVELVTEFAKDLVYDEHMHALSQQNYVFANQEFRLSRLVGKVDYAITDSPLILSNIYRTEDYPSSFSDFCYDMFDRYNNINFFIEPNHAYSEFGRIHSECEASAISEKIKYYLEAQHIKYTSFNAGDHVPEKIYEIIQKLYCDCL